ARTSRDRRGQQRQRAAGDAPAAPGVAHAQGAGLGVIPTTIVSDAAARTSRDRGDWTLQRAAGDVPADRSEAHARGAARTVRRPITIGDVLRAFRELGATGDDERRAIARLLGYDLEGAAGSQVTPQPIAPRVVAPRPFAKPEVAEPIAPVDSD